MEKSTPALGLLSLAMHCTNPTTHFKCRNNAYCFSSHSTEHAEAEIFGIQRPLAVK